MHHDVFEPGTKYPEGDTVRVLLVDGHTRIACVAQKIKRHLRIVEPSDAQENYKHRAFNKAGYCSDTRPYLRPLTDEKLQVMAFVNSLGYDNWSHLIDWHSSLESAHADILEVVARRRQSAVVSLTDRARYLKDADTAAALAASLEEEAESLEQAAAAALAAAKGSTCQQPA